MQSAFVFFHLAWYVMSLTKQQQGKVSTLISHVQQECCFLQYELESPDISFLRRCAPTRLGLFVALRPPCVLALTGPSRKWSIAEQRPGSQGLGSDRAEIQRPVFPGRWKSPVQYCWVFLHEIVSVPCWKPTQCTKNTVNLPLAYLLQHPTLTGSAFFSSHLLSSDHSRCSWSSLSSFPHSHP